MKLLSTFLLSLAALGTFGMAAAPTAMSETTASTSSTGNVQRITMGGGCFWCLEAIFQRLNGVQKVVSGYAGGKTANPTYHQVCEGDTGHAEVVQIEFDSSKLPLEKLLEVFWAAHDPTTLNRQGHDVGTQYRSVLFYENDEQKQAMEESKKVAQKDQKDPIVTEIVPLKAFYAAEKYHQNYYNQNAETNGYCSAVIRPKLVKLLHSGLIKE